MTGRRALSSRNRGSGGAVSVGGIDITHPNKIWWPEEKITKLDIARYYETIAPRILPWLKDHPLTAERCPDGIVGECFFQKNFLNDLPPDVPTRAIPTERNDDIVHYVIGGSTKSLLALVNLGCIAVHVMNCKIDTLDYPTWLAFDLDPSSGKFSDAAKAGTVLHEILDELRIRSYPKTSGGKGLHVLIPLKHGPNQDKVREFAHQIGQEMVNRSPELITVQMSKSKRKGRVFADWLRNAFGQTIAAPYSVRRRLKAPVSTPLHWEEVDRKLEPSSFNVLTIEHRLRRKDPWADFWRYPQVLPSFKLLHYTKT